MHTRIDKSRARLVRFLLANVVSPDEELISSKKLALHSAIVFLEGKGYNEKDIAQIIKEES